MCLDDTIVAIATPLQPSGLGIIRVSGNESISLIEPLFKAVGNKLKEAKTHKLIHGWIHEDGKLLDQVLIVVMRAPHSYTTEDVIEIQCHGSPIVLRNILSLLLRKGARLAKAGEFTQRAFLHGRIDLTQAEAVADLIHASSDVAANLALQQLHGKLYDAINQVKNQLISVASLVEANIEFPDEETEFTQRDACLQSLNCAAADLENLVSHADQGRRMREGFSVALIGRPNVGKSSLLNTLLCEQRAIVTPLPGTTRDSIEESIQIRGLAFRLTDTAGIRDTEDLIETAGIQRTHNTWQRADLVLLILDASEKLEEDDLSLIHEVDKNRTLAVLNKKDLLSEELPLWHEEISGLESVLISAKSGAGRNELEAMLFAKATLEGLPQQDDIWLTNLRQQEAAKRALTALSRAKEGLEQFKGEEFLAVDLRSSLNALGEIVGETTADDLLGQIFSKFCIGK
ncbi:MAG: tRNA uridine-5-carboxymethylaminomethyl(34) synthesis GTPase MnmE [SAR324 cluster bacterium]|nr:tRNA uridine-5-carboxymethylaminomethyl(34) synthesis GTPase MnmE [SAR324 cluster bacterium]MBL7034166.1 tRNA uridine-5-carboxymethylaminomethyl(34) synthesis GTPase MnmE [SAR324 cluster bacterium]